LTYLSAQSQSSEIIGSVRGVDGHTPDIIYVILKSLTNPEKQFGESFLDGEFLFKDLSPQEYNLTISAVGYEKVELKIKVEAQKTTYLDTIVLQSKGLLKDIEVKGKRPTFIRKDGKFIFTVENSGISDVGNSIDILKQTPMVIVDNGDNLIVGGKTNPIVLIDDRKINSKSELEALNSSDIKTIEIITNPSAKYDASGHAVINIITKKNSKSDGLSSSVKLQSTFARKEKYLGGITLGYKQNRLVLYTNYQFSNGKQINLEKDYRTTALSSEDLYITNYDDESKSNFIEHDYRFGVKYDINIQQSIGIQLSGYSGNSKDKSDIVNSYLFQDKSGINYNTTSSDNNFLFNDVNLNYQLKLDSLGQKIVLLSDYAYYWTNSNGFIIETDNLETLNSRFENRIDYKIFSSSLDYELPLKSIGLNISTGLKYSLVENRGDNLFETETATGFDHIGLYSDMLYYQESNYAAYLILSKKLNKLKLSIGTRAEYLFSEGSSKSETIRDTSFLDLFPNIELSYQPSKEFSVSFSYTEKINRPSYSTLNPAVTYFDKYFALVGNPELISSISKTYEVSSSLFKQVIVNMGYMKVIDPIYPYYYQDEGNIELTFVKRWNYPVMRYYFGNITHSYEKKNFFMQNSIGIKKPEMEIKVLEDNKKLNQPMFYLRNSSNITLPHEIILYSSFTLLALGETAMDKQEPFYDISIGVRKKFFNDKLSVNVYYSDVFATWISKSSWEIYNWQRYHEFSGDTSYLRFRISYNIGTFNPTLKKHSSSEKELERL
jgi:hypothetical protein